MAFICNAMKDGFSIRLDTATRRRLDRVAKQQYRMASQVIREALDKYLDAVEADAKRQAAAAR